MMALCGGIMIGVAVPVIIASLDKVAVMFFGIFMLLSGICLVASIKTKKELMKKTLLIIHILIGLVILVGMFLSNLNIFLVCWSLLVILLAVLSMFGYKNEQSI